jgi:hypothetical protein
MTLRISGKDIDVGGASRGTAEMMVLRHAGHGGPNVVYRRADGSIGWIDPAPSAS